MGNMFLGSEMMFDMIRNYFGVEKNDLIFRPLGRRFDEVRQKVTPPLGGGGHDEYLAVTSPGGLIHLLKFGKGILTKIIFFVKVCCLKLCTFYSNVIQ